MTKKDRRKTAHRTEFSLVWSPHSWGGPKFLSNYS
jgi:hypothetical protein